jgi:hypothetical protein
MLSSSSVWPSGSVIITWMHMVYLLSSVWAECTAQHIIPPHCLILHPSRNSFKWERWSDQRFFVWNPPPTRKILSLLLQGRIYLSYRNFSKSTTSNTLLPFPVPPQLLCLTERLIICCVHAILESLVSKVHPKLWLKWMMVSVHQVVAAIPKSQRHSQQMNEIIYSSPPSQAFPLESYQIILTLMLYSI